MLSFENIQAYTLVRSIQSNDCRNYGAAVLCATVLSVGKVGSLSTKKICCRTTMII